MEGRSLYRKPLKSWNGWVGRVIRKICRRLPRRKSLSRVSCNFVACSWTHGKIQSIRLAGPIFQPAQKTVSLKNFYPHYVKSTLSPTFFVNGIGHCDSSDDSSSSDSESLSPSKDRKKQTHSQKGKDSRKVEKATEHLNNKYKDPIKTRKRDRSSSASDSDSSSRSRDRKMHKTMNKKLKQR